MYLHYCGHSLNQMLGSRNCHPKNITPIISFFRGHSLQMATYYSKAEHCGTNMTYYQVVCLQYGT